jgi:hypothetical protein
MPGRSVQPLVMAFIATCAVAVERSPVPPAGGASIPAGLEQATPFVEFLRSAGLTLLEVRRSHLESMFRDTRHAAYIRTDRGVVEVVVFDGATDAERMTITYSKTSSPGGRHRYLLHGPSDGEVTEWEGAQPAYFTLHRNWFIVTWQPELDAFVKRSLGQTSRPDLLK